MAAVYVIHGSGRFDPHQGEEMENEYHRVIW